MRLPIISGRNWQYTWLARGSRASRDTQPDECSFASWEASRDLSIQESHLSESRFHFVFSDIYYFSSKRGKIFFLFFWGKYPHLVTFSVENAKEGDS